MIRVAYSSAASAHAKWPASTLSDLLWGSHLCRYSPFTGSTPGSWSPVMVCTGVSIVGSSLPSTGSSVEYERTKRSDSTKRLEARRFDDVFQHRADLNRHGGRAVADDDAP